MAETDFPLTKNTPHNPISTAYLRPGLEIISGILIFVGLYLASLYNYLLFHTLAELFSIAVTTAIFMLVWNAWSYIDNGYLKFLGIAMLFVGILDLVHTLAYAGMNIFTGYDANLPTQLWIATRYLQALSMLAAPYFLTHPVRRGHTFTGFLAVSTLLLLLIFAGIFPDCYIEGSGLTPFKIISEYIIGLILVGAVVSLYRQRTAFSREVFRWLVIAIWLTIGSELAFTFYISVYGFSNLIGHFFKLLAFYYIYKAIIQTGLTKPYNLLFRELKQREEQLQQARDAAQAANQAKSAFLANMSHELRSPLNVILGFTHLSLQNQNLSPDDRDNLTAIYHSGEHLLELINNVLDMSKIEAGRSTLKEVNFNLRVMLTELEGMFRLKAEQKGLALEISCQPDVPAVICTDQGKLRQVLINLLGNALKFTEQGSVTLRVGLYPGEEQRLGFEISDTGPGIPADELDTIFEPFAQSRTGQNHAEGTGLGLSISRQFVQLMGGNLVVSGSPPPGATFSFSINYIAAGPHSPAAVAAERIIGLAPNQQTYRILVADDQSYNRRLMTKLLAPLGFELREAADGREALQLWRQWQPHLIWMDMRMPVMDGYQATQQIKATEQGQATAVIALTASVFEEERGLVLLSGCDGFIRKPFRDTDIFDALRQHLGVKFLVQSGVTPFPAKDARPATVNLSPQDLAALPETYISSLNQATRRNDPDMAEAVIDNISQEYPDTAHALSQLVSEFRFDRLQQLIEESAR
ncbi:MAG: hypothetical protein Kow0031_28470 [Anaerolineae bacterium]